MWLNILFEPFFSSREKVFFEEIYEESPMVNREMRGATLQSRPACRNSQNCNVLPDFNGSAIAKNPYYAIFMALS